MIYVNTSSNFHGIVPCVAIRSSVVKMASSRFLRSVANKIKTACWNIYEGNI